LEQQDAASKNSCPACGPGGFIAGRDVRAAFFWLLFFAVQRKVTRAKRETLFSFETRAKARSKAPLLNPPLRCAQGRRQKSKGKSKSQHQDQNGSQLSLG
jgi:hypothetical protein